MKNALTMFTFCSLLLFPLSGQFASDLILVTHQHGDHLDLSAINQVLKEDTRVVMTQACKDQLADFDALVMGNGDRESIMGIGIEAIPAYNIQHTRAGGNPYHPKGEGNGYILSFGSTNVLIGGDTENTPELKGLKIPIPGSWWNC